MPDPCELVAITMGSLFDCAPAEPYTRIRTPYLYPDGDVIDLFLKETNSAGEWATVTDLGETLRWLRMQTPAQRKSPKQRQLIDNICITHGVELFRGMLMARVKERGELAEAVARLS